MALVLTLALAVLPATHAGIAQADVTGDGSGDTGDRWWGGVGTLLCGTEMRLVSSAPAIGLNPYVMAAGIGGCLLAVLDIATT